MPVRIELAGVHQVDGVFPLVAEGLERACRKTGGDLTAEYLWTETRSGKAFLIVVSRDAVVIGATVLRFENWSSGKKLRCLAMWGRDMRTWLPRLMEMAKEMARLGGANALVSEGRKGFERVFDTAKVLRQTYEVPL